MLEDAALPPDGGAAAGLAADRADTQQTAADIAALVAAKMREGAARPEAVSSPPPPAAQVTEGQPDAATGVVDEGASVEFAPEAVAAAEQGLLAAGVNLGVDRASLSPEAQVGYDKFVVTAADHFAVLAQEQQQAQEAIGMVNDFRQRLESEPDRVLLTMALNKPEVFQQVADLVSAAAQDPKIKEGLLRELASEARMREVERREKAFTQTQLQQAVRGIVASTRNAARKYGVDFSVAEKMVATFAKSNGGKLISGQEIDALVSQLKPAGPRRPPVAGTVKAKPTAPTQSVAGAAAAGAGAAASASPGLVPGKTPGSSLKDLIKGAMARTNAALTS